MGLDKLTNKLKNNRKNCTIL